MAEIAFTSYDLVSALPYITGQINVKRKNNLICIQITNLTLKQTLHISTTYLNYVLKQQQIEISFYGIEYKVLQLVLITIKLNEVQQTALLNKIPLLSTTEKQHY